MISRENINPAGSLSKTPAGARHSIWRFSLLVLLLGLATHIPNANAEENDAFNGQDILNEFVDQTVDKTSKAAAGVLADLGKNLAAMALDSYIPGLSSLLGLGGGGDPFAAHAQEIIDAVKDEGTKTRNVMMSFWEWAQDHANAEIYADWDTAVHLLNEWNGHDLQTKIWSHNDLFEIHRDFYHVMSTLAHMPTPDERLDWLHSYGTIVGITLMLQDELARIYAIGAQFDASGFATVEEWWESLDTSEQAEYDEQIRQDTLENRRSLLLGNAGVFEYINMMGLGSLDGNETNLSDLEAVWDSRFWHENPWTGNGASAYHEFQYFFKRGLEPGCVNGVNEYCAAECIGGDSTCGRYRIRRYTSYSSAHPNGIHKWSGDNYQETFDSVEEIWDMHRDMVWEEMLWEGYGPIRVLLDKWWLTLEKSGYRPYNRLDQELEQMLGYDFELGGFSLSYLKHHCVSDGFPTNQEGSLLVGFLLEHGKDALDDLFDAAWDTINPMVPPSASPYGNMGRYPFHVYRGIVEDGIVDRSDMVDRFQGHGAALILTSLPI